MLGFLVKARLARKKSRSALAELCGVSANRVLDWELGYAKIPPQKQKRICLWLRLTLDQLPTTPAVRKCWICEDPDHPVDRAHVVPRENTLCESQDRPENLADLCPSHHRKFDAGGLQTGNIVKLYSSLLPILETCGGNFAGECNACVYEAPLRDCLAPYCANSRLLQELANANSKRLKPLE